MIPSCLSFLNLAANIWYVLIVLQVQERFEVDIKELPEQIDTSTYSKLLSLSFSASLCLKFLGVLRFHKKLRCRCKICLVVRQLSS